MSVCIALSLTMLTLAFKQFGEHSSFRHITRPSFVISTALLSIVVGGLFAHDLLFRSRGPDRIYLSPAEFQALTPTDRALLQPISQEGPEPPTEQLK
jgi:hypothetical protein